MRAAFIDKIKSVKFTDLPEPQIKESHEVKIQVKFTGICGSELHAYHGTHPFRFPPLVSGHEFAGIVVEVGSDVRDIRVGDRVSAEPQVACGSCVPCKSGLYHMCNQKRVLGAMGWSGSFGEYIVMPREVLLKLPDEVPLEHGALIEPLAVGMRAVRHSLCGMGDKILVIGCGPIGLGIIMAAKLAGCAQIYASDAAPFNLEMAKKMGATGVLNPRTQDIREAARHWTDGNGMDFTFLAFGNGPIVTDAIEVTRKQGTIMEVAVLGAPFEVDFHNFYQKEIRMLGSNVYTAIDFEIVLQGMRQGKFPLDGYITHVYPVEQVEEAFDLLETRRENVIKVLLQFS